MAPRPFSHSKRRGLDLKGAAFGGRKLQSLFQSLAGGHDARENLAQNRVTDNIHQGRPFRDLGCASRARGRRRRYRK